MRITKLGWFFHLLGLLALVLAFGVMFAGCDASIITVGGGLVLGGIIGSILGHVFIGIIVGGIIGLIVFLIITRSSSSGSSFNSYRYHESRKNDPHTCGNCTKYSSGRGECRLNGNPMSAEDSCSNWC